MKSLKESPVYLLNLFNNVINLFQKDIEDLPICPTKINSDKAIELIFVGHIGKSSMSF